MERSRSAILGTTLCSTALAAAAVLGTAPGLAQTAVAAPQRTTAAVQHHALAKHVLVISVDGMHQSDLDWYVARHPHSTLARMAADGTEFTRASTSNPSDSSPGGTAIMTGG